MSEKEKVIALLDQVPEYKMGYILAFIQGATLPENADTLEAMEEVQRMKEDPNLGKRYTDVDAMMKELLA